MAPSCCAPRGGRHMEAEALGVRVAEDLLSRGRSDSRSRLRRGRTSVNGWRLLLTRPDESAALVNLGERASKVTCRCWRSIAGRNPGAAYADVSTWTATARWWWSASRRRAWGWSGSTATGSRRSRPGAASARRPRRSSRPRPRRILPEQGDDSEALAGAAGAPGFPARARSESADHARRVAENSSPSPRAAKACRWTTCHSTGAGLRTIRPESCWQGAGGTPERPGGQQWTGFAKSVSVGGSRLAQIGRLPLFVPTRGSPRWRRELGAQRVIDCRGASAASLAGGP